MVLAAAAIQACMQTDNLILLLRCVLPHGCFGMRLHLCMCVNEWVQNIKLALSIIKLLINSWRKTLATMHFIWWHRMVRPTCLHFICIQYILSLTLSNRHTYTWPWNASAMLHVCRAIRLCKSATAQHMCSVHVIEYQCTTAYFTGFVHFTSCVRAAHKYSGYHTNTRCRRQLDDERLMKIGSKVANHTTQSRQFIKIWPNEDNKNIFSAASKYSRIYFINIFFFI